MVNFKQYPEIPLTRALQRQVYGEPWMEDMLRQENPLDGSGSAIDADSIARTVAEWESIFEDIRLRLLANDRKMIEGHRRRRDLAVRHMYREGDYVLVRARTTGKQKARAVGPFVFKRYLGERGVNAEVVELGNGKSREVSVGNLLPMHPAT